MSCDNYCPEVHNASESEDSDYNVESISSEDCGQCWDCEENKDCPAKIKEEEVKKKLQEKIDSMIKKEVNDKMKVPDRMEHPAFKELKNPDFHKLKEIDKINKVAVAFHKSGGILVENILELKMLMVLIGATEQLEGFKEFPRKEVIGILEMVLYHANKHIESLDI